MPSLLLLPTACCAAVAAAATSSAAFSRPPPSRLRASHLPFAFRRLRKYGRRDREPVASTSFDEEESDDDDEDDDDGVEEAVDEDIFLKNRPKPAGFGVGKTYTTDIEERLLREMGLGGAARKSEPAPAPAKQLRAADSAKETGGDSTDGIHVRIWNLPKKKNIHKDLNLAFKRFPGLITINPANSANKKTRDPVCKGFAFLKMESLEAATRFVELYSCKSVLFGKVEKPIKCCIVDGHSSTDTSNKPSSTQAAGSTLQRLVAVR